MSKLMAIFAHPDDEGAIGGALAHYAESGVEVSLVCATRGEVGEISDPSLATPETLGTVREAELGAAAEILGIRHLRFLDRRDSGMDGTPENEDPRSLVQSDPEEIIGKLVGLMRELEPDIVVTFEPFGWYGHPDHQVMSTWATAAYRRLLAETAVSYKPKRLYHAVIPFSGFRVMLEEAMEAGYIEDEGFGDELLEQARLDTEAEVTHVIDIQDHFGRKREAMAAHQTQFSPDHMFNKIPSELMRKTSGWEHFIQVEPAPNPEQKENRLGDLFVGI